MCPEPWVLRVLLDKPGTQAQNRKQNPPASTRLHDGSFQTASALASSIATAGDHYKLGPYLHTEYLKYPHPSDERKLWLKRRRVWLKSIRPAATPEEKKEKKAEYKHRELVNQQNRVLAELRKPSLNVPYKRKREEEPEVMYSMCVMKKHRDYKNLIAAEETDGTAISGLCKPPKRILNNPVCDNDKKKHLIRVPYDVPYFPPFIIRPEDYPPYDEKPEKAKAIVEKAPSPDEGRIKTYKKFKIGPDNIGRAMLNLMGWDSGTGLGKLGNGRKDPVPVRFKGAKYGLGYVRPT